MKRWLKWIALPAVLLACMAFAAPKEASAQGFGIYIGRGYPSYGYGSYYRGVNPYGPSYGYGSYRYQSYYGSPYRSFYGGGYPSYYNHHHHCH